MVVCGNAVARCPPLLQVPGLRGAVLAAVAGVGANGRRQRAEEQRRGAPGHVRHWGTAGHAVGILSNPLRFYINYYRGLDIERESARITDVGHADENLGFPSFFLLRLIAVKIHDQTRKRTVCTACS